MHLNNASFYKIGQIKFRLAYFHTLLFHYYLSPISESVKILLLHLFM